MKCGYSVRQRPVAQIVCNDNKSWYRRDWAGSGYGAWQRINPPVIINDCLQQGREILPLKRLRVEPFNVPQR